MSLAGTLGGNTSDQARPFEKGAGFFSAFGADSRKMQKGIQSKRTKKGEEKMTVFDELKARGLLAQLTDEEEIKELIKKLKEVNQYVKGNIFKSVENVNLETVVAYKKDGVKHHFLDDYDTKK